MQAQGAGGGLSKTPAARIIARFGVAQIARWTGRDRSRVHAWTWTKARGGTGGVIPHSVRRAIIEGAAQLGEELGYADFEPRAGEAYIAEPTPHIRAAEDVQ